MSETTVTIKMSRKQAEMVRDACEEYCRLRMGQFWDLADDLAEDAFPEKKDFDRMIEWRDNFRDIITGLLPYDFKLKGIPNDALIAETVWLAIRSKLAWHDNPEGNPWSVVYDPVFSRCEEKIPEVTINND